MILIVNLVCPNGHNVCGTPHEYRGEGIPPDQWMHNLGQQLMNKVRERGGPHEVKECPFCHVPFSMERGTEWAVSAHEMYAETMAEAHAALMRVSEADNKCSAEKSQ